MNIFLVLKLVFISQISEAFSSSYSNNSDASFCDRNRLVVKLEPVKACGVHQNAECRDWDEFAVKTHVKPYPNGNPGPTMYYSDFKQTNLGSNARITYKLNGYDAHNCRSSENSCHYIGLLCDTSYNASVTIQYGRGCQEDATRKVTTRDKPDVTLGIPNNCGPSRTEECKGIDTFTVVALGISHTNDQQPTIMYTINYKDYDQCRNSLFCKFSGLESLRNYTVGVAVTYGGKCTKSDTYIATTLGLPDVMFRPTESSGLVQWRTSREFPNPEFEFILEWTSLACTSSHARIRDIHETITTNSYTIDMNKYLYSQIYISVSSVHEGFKGKAECVAFKNEREGVPGTSIVAVSCTQNTVLNPYCALHLNTSCMLRKSKQTWINMNYRANDELLAIRTGGSGNKQVQFFFHESVRNIYFLDEWLPYVSYHLSFQVQNGDGEFNQTIIKTQDIISKPAAPGIVRNLKVIPSVKSAVLSFDEPGDDPPKGKLEKFKVEFSQDTRWSYRDWRHRHPIAGSICSDGSCIFTIEPLAEGTGYTFRVQAFNEGVKSPGPVEEIAAKTRTWGPPEVKISRNKNSNKIRWNIEEDPPDDIQYRFSLTTKSIACENSEPYMKQIEDTIPEKSYTVNWNDYIYSLIKISVWSLSKKVYSKESTWLTNNTQTSAPETPITHLACTNNSVLTPTCTVSLDHNCMLRKSKTTKVAMSYKVQNQALRNHRKAQGIQSKEYSFHQSLSFQYSTGWIPFSKYKLEFIVTNGHGVSNPFLTRSIEVTTKPAAPGPVTEVSSSSSSTTATLVFKYPTDEPARGILQHFDITQNQRPFRMHVPNYLGRYQFVDICSQLTKTCEITIRNLNPEIQYDFKITASNKGASETSEAKTFVVTTKLPDPEPVTIKGIDESNWNIEIEDPNKMIPEYKLQLSKNSSLVAEKQFTSMESLSLPFINLDPSSKYTVKIAACRDFCGNFSIPFTFWTKPKPFETPSPPEQEFYLTNETSLAIILSDLPDRINSYSRCLVVMQEGLEARNSSEFALENCFFSEACNSSMDGPIDACTITSSDEVEYFRVDDKSKGYRFQYLVNASSGNHVLIKMSRRSEIYRVGIGNGSAVALGVSFGLIIPLMICLLALLAFKRYGLPPKLGPDKGSNSVSLMDSETAKSSKDFLLLNDIPKDIKIPTLVSPVLKPQAASPNRAELDDVEQYLLDAIVSPQLDEKYQTVPLSMPGMTSLSASSEENKGKNRYKNILPYDETRVKLPTKKSDPASDYINANYIHTNSRMRAFIATQGPKHDPKFDTREDFWRMIWHTEASHIVMVANLVEGTKDKVGRYFASEGSIVFGSYKVTTEKTTNKGDYLIRNFLVYDGSSEKKIRQYQYTAWPDHGKPENCVTLAQMIEEIVPQMDLTKPIVVHCSAGIGRTGTILMILMALEQMATGYLDMVEILQDLRRCRPRLVEKSQFRYAHDLLLEIWLKSMRHSTLDSLYSNIDEMTDNSTEEFTRLKKLVFRDAPVHFDDQTFLEMHRNPSVVPAASRRIMLKGYAPNDIRSYVPAVRIKGLLRDCNFIVLEHPISSMLDQALTMIHEKRIKNWLFLNTYGRKEKDFPRIVPNASESFKINVRETTKTSQYTKKVITLQKNFGEDSTIHECSLIQYLSWPYGTEEPKEISSLLTLAHEIAFDLSQPAAVITCGDGFTASGLFLAICIELQRSKYAGESGVYLTCLRLRMDRPQFFKSHKQYKFIYDALRTYKETFSSGFS